MGGCTASGSSVFWQWSSDPERSPSFHSQYLWILTSDAHEYEIGLLAEMPLMFVAAAAPRSVKARLSFATFHPGVGATLPNSIVRLYFL